MNGMKKSPESDNSEDSEMEEDIFHGSLLADSPTPSEECSSTEKSQNSAACTSLNAKKMPSEPLMPQPTEAASSTAMFGVANAFDPLQFDPLRLLMNRSLNATVLNPILAQPAAMLSLQQQLSKHISSTLVQPNLKPNPGCVIRQHETDNTETSSGTKISLDRKRTVDCGSNSSSISTTPKRSKLLIDEILNLKTNETYSADAHKSAADGCLQQESFSLPSTSREQSAEPNLTKEDEKAPISDNCVTTDTDAIFVVPADSSNSHRSSEAC
uniref:Prospero domain-containing protein n=1 Tax=Elaeophora elaphi TaxID=1147741 RepID=A0A0R3RHG3_9BILA